MNYVRRFLERISELAAGITVFTVVTFAIVFGLMAALKDRLFRKPMAVTPNIVNPHAEAELRTKLTKIDTALDAAKQEDTVVFANRFILDHWGKK